MPLDKKVNLLNPINYGCSHILTKVLEREILSQIIQYLSVNQLRPPNHQSYIVCITKPKQQLLFDTVVKAVDEGGGR